MGFGLHAWICRGIMDDLFLGIYGFIGWNLLPRVIFAAAEVVLLFFCEETFNYPGAISGELLECCHCFTDVSD